MTIRVTIEFANEAELIAYFNKAPVATSDGVTLQPAKAPEAKKPDAPTASSQPTAKPRPEAQQAAAQETATASAPAETSKAYTVDDAKALTMKLVASKGRDAAKGLLDKYDVPVAAKLPAEKVGEFCREAEGLLA